LRISDCGFRNGKRTAGPKSEIPNPKCETGFTLVEVVLVAVIIGVLLASVAPRFQQTSQRLRAEHAAFELAQLARLAHERAVSEGRDFRWIWDAEERRARVEPVGAAGESQTDDAPADRTTSARLPADAVVSVTRDRREIECGCLQFFPGGTAEAGVVTVETGGGAFTVTVDAATAQARITAGAPAR
jgi:type II secretion system protein H